MPDAMIFIMIQRSVRQVGTVKKYAIDSQQEREYSFDILAVIRHRTVDAAKKRSQCCKKK